MKPVLPSLLTTLLLFGSFTTTLSATEQQRRFSMAISGGASKGAYEAGLNWGLLKMMQDISKIEYSMIGEARTLEAASFSGASAGGINTVLSGLTWCSLPQAKGGLANTIDENIFRDVWLAPDVNRLLPPTADSIYYNDDDALLARYDLLQASQKLRERWNQPGFRAGCRGLLARRLAAHLPDRQEASTDEKTAQPLHQAVNQQQREDPDAGRAGREQIMEQADQEDRPDRHEIGLVDRPVIDRDQGQRGNDRQPR